jgi:hypothetical protein
MSATDSVELRLDANSVYTLHELGTILYCAHKFFREFSKLYLKVPIEIFYQKFYPFKDQICSSFAQI